ncbi:hypothetical protein IEQ34_000900 [Dendrobium chrysotoxum]|uniref:Uncharacterized protein n=1 Tax=Dendrobium chrysotoxum TaxID=161865 RepID=A0AAV7HLS9_DENCH|nr:hypothetical protein IEQ34_000900 [Dendrobium chrysotoxum]
MSAGHRTAIQYLFPANRTLPDFRNPERHHRRCSSGGSAASRRILHRLHQPSAFSRSVHMRTNHRPPPATESGEA